MSIEFFVLSGTRQGERIPLAAARIKIGHDPSCDLYFDPQIEPSMAGRAATLISDGEGWTVVNEGSGKLMVNQKIVDRPTLIRSGDILRLSESGPDLIFTIHTDGFPEDSPEKVDRAPKAPPTSLPTKDAVAELDEKPSWFSGRWVAGVAGGVILVVILALFTRQQDGKQQPADVAFQLLALPDATIAEGQTLAVDAKFQARDPSSIELTLECPRTIQAEMSAAGEIRWTPREKDGPGKYVFTVVAKDNSQDPVVEDQISFSVFVTEVGQPPSLTAVRDQTVAANTELRLVMQARDPDIPEATLDFRMQAGAPAGMKIDAESGRLVWTPTAEQAGKTYSVSVRAEKRQDRSLFAATSFQVTVTAGDKWIGVARQNEDALRLIMLQEPNSQTLFPLGTATFIRNDALLTSATVAVELEKRRQTGWKAWARHPARDEREEVTGILVHRAFQELAGKPEDQIYFDAAILKVVEKPRTVCRLAAADDSRPLAAGSKVGVHSIPHRAEPLTRFTKLRPELTVGTIVVVDSLKIPGQPGAIGAPRLWHLRSKLPSHVYGSPVLNQAGRLVAVYAERATLPDPPPELIDVHYAAGVTLVGAWLKGQGVAFWQAPKPQTPPPPDSGKANPTKANPTKANPTKANPTKADSTKTKR